MRPPYRLVFFSSLSILSFEIALIRIFSIRFSYHYASLIISISMLGLVLGGIYTYFKTSSRHPISLAPHLLVIALALSYPAIFIFSSVIPLDHYRMLWENAQILYLFLFIASCSIPFFLYGIILSSCLSSYPREANRIYASDLLGAAVGVALVMLLMDYIKVEYIIVILSAMLAIQLLFEPKRGIGKVLYITTPLLLCIPVIYGLFAVHISPYKGLMQALKDDDAKHIQIINTSHSRLDVFENTRMKFAPGLSLVYTKPIPKGSGIAIDGDIVGVMIDEKNIKEYDFLSFMPSALPYLLKNNKDVMVVGFKNSLDALSPYYFGADNVYLIEKDLSVLQFVNSYYGVNSLYRKSTYYTTMRKFLSKLQKKFDVIFISKTGFFPSGNFGLQEDYDMTVDALRLCISQLKDDGFLFIQMFLLPPPRYELRMMNNLLHALNGDIDTRLLIFRSWDTINFLIKRSGLTKEEFAKAQRFLTERELEMLYPVPDTTERFITGVDYRNLFRYMVDKKTGDTFVKKYPFNISATHNDKPFFHYFLKLQNIREIYTLSGKKWAYFLFEGMALPFILAFLILLSIVIFIATFLLSKERGLKPANRNPQHDLNKLCYFALIGFSFMFIEVFFIHTLILPLGSPVTAFSVTLFTLLLSSGCGSLISGYMKANKAFYTMFIAPVLLLFYFFLFKNIVNSSFSFVALIPVGICLGFFFPTGLKYLCRERKGMIPLAYAINGTSSIIAPMLASMVAVTWGLKILLLLSAILYGTTLLLIFPHIVFKKSEIPISKS